MERMEIVPASRTTLAQSIADQIISLILEGHIKPGSRLPSQHELSVRFQVGRSTVREALTTVAALGLVEMRVGQGTFVKKFGPGFALQPDVLAKPMDAARMACLFEARSIIEPEIARLAAEKATDEDLAAIRKILAKAQQALEVGEPVRGLSSAFHLEIAKACHNEVLLTFVESILGTLLERNLLLENQRGYRRWELRSHRGVYECISRHDGQGASAAMAKHIKDTDANLLQVISAGEVQATEIP